MAVVLKRGNKHMMHVWYTNCEYCDSRLKMFQEGDDPAINNFSWAGTNTVLINYTCPVCGETQEAYAHEFDDYGTDPKNIIHTDMRRAAIRCNTKREYKALSQEERAEVESYRAKDEEEASDE